MAKSIGDYGYWNRRIEQLLRKTGGCGTDTGFEGAGTWSPPTDVFETSDGVVVKMELPGVRPGDLSVVLVDDRLLVRGCRRDPDAGRRIQYHQMEIEYGSFAKLVAIRMPYDREGIRSELAGGYLSLTIPRATGETPSEVVVEISL